MVFKCKICGGALELDGARSVAVCPYCGTKQTLPKPGDERRANLYDRANHFRRNNDFDKAAGIYEAILNEDPTDAEAYWSIVLCRYGIEYVEDPATRKRVPTVNRAQYTSIFDDEDYKAALQYADAAQREVYEAEAKAINEIQRGILDISQKEEPFDVFLSCKETDASGRRTPDSVLASEIYNELTAQGIRTFFARITLEDKLGSAYEPYIFAALHSAKVMVVVGTKPEHFNAVWVKNEWSRYLALIKGGEKKTVIPAFRDMDPYDLPDEFSHLQAQDMSKLGFLQDLVRGIRKILDADAPGASPLRKTVVVTAPAAVEPLFRRAELALSDREFDRADDFYEQILNQEPENADAYVGKLLVELRVSERSSLSACDVSFENSDAYKKAMRFGDDALKKELSGALRAVLARLEERKRVAAYERATVLFIRAGDLPSCTEAKRLFQSISGYRDADKCVSLCDEKIAELRAEWEKLREEKRIAAEERKRRAKKTRKRALIVLLSILLVAAIAVPTCLYVFGVAIPNAKCEKALELIEEKRFDEAEELLDEAWYYAISKKTQDKLDRAYEALDDAKSRAAEDLDDARYRAAEALYESGDYEGARDAFEEMDGYKDSDERIEVCNEAIRNQRYESALALYNEGRYEEAIAAFEETDGYKDSAEQIEICSAALREEKYVAAKAAIVAQNYVAAYEGLIAMPGYKDSASLASSIRNKYLEQKDVAAVVLQLRSAKAGDVVSFGVYEQDNNSSNGKEKIQWRVLDKKSDRVLIISDKALECLPFDTTEAKNVTWETCTLRSWLNGAFLNDAFSAYEQSKILNTTVSADGNPRFSVNPGNTTVDKVFLLSAVEAEKYFSGENALLCKTTAHVTLNNENVLQSGYGDAVSWWLRTPGSERNSAVFVSRINAIQYEGLPHSIINTCVRPAMWIDTGS